MILSEELPAHGPARTSPSTSSIIAWVSCMDVPRKDARGLQCSPNKTCVRNPPQLPSSPLHTVSSRMSPKVLISGPPPGKEVEGPTPPPLTGQGCEAPGASCAALPVLCLRRCLLCNRKLEDCVVGRLQGPHVLKAASAACCLTISQTGTGVGYHPLAKRHGTRNACN